jgi:trigger factor
MQVQVADAGTLRKRVSISYTASEVTARRDRILGELAGQVKLPGFRPGKSPKAMLEKRFGADAARQTAADLAEDGLRKAISDNKLRPFGPVANDERGEQDGLSFVFSFEVKPDIILPDPKTLSVTDEAVVVPAEEIEKSIEGLCRRAGTEGPLAADETIVEDDGLTITGKVLRDGTAVRDLHDFHHLVGGYPLLGKPPAEVVAALKDKKVGDAVRLDTVLPKSFTPAEHAEKPAVLEFTIQSAKRLRAAPASDETAGKFGFKDLAALREYFASAMTRGKEDEKRRGQVEQLVGKLIDALSFEIPPVAKQGSVTQALAAFAAEAEKNKTPAEEVEKGKAEIPAKVERDLKRFLIVDALAEKLAVQVSNQDISEQIMLAAQQTGRRPEDIAKQLKESGQVNQVVMEIREAKALELFLDQVLGRPAPALAAAAAHGEPGHVHGPDCNH